MDPNSGFRGFGLGCGRTTWSRFAWWFAAGGGLVEYVELGGGFDTKASAARDFRLLEVRWRRHVGHAGG